MLRTSLAAFLLVSALELLPASALYTSKSPVLQVDAKNYKRLIASSNHVSVLEFYAPWCGHCQNLKPAYEKAAKSLEGLAQVAAINCDDEDNKPLCGRMGIQGFPTLKIVVPSKKTGKPVVEDYNGPRSAKAIVDAVIDRIPNHVKRLTDDNIDEWLAKDEGTPRAILFSSKGTTSALLKALAIDSLGSIQVGQVRSKEQKTVDTYDISTFPTLVLLPGDGKDPITYDGEMKKKPMSKFLSQVIKTKPSPAAETPKTKAKKAKETDQKEEYKNDKKRQFEHPGDESSEDSSKQETKGGTADKANKPSPSGDPPKVKIQSLYSFSQAREKCLSPTTGLCLIALVVGPKTSSEASEIEGDLENISGVLGQVAQGYTQRGSKIFPFYVAYEFGNKFKNFKEKLELPSDGNYNIFAINGRRGWWSPFDLKKHGNVTKSKLGAWVEAVKVGDVEKKKLPEDALEDDGKPDEIDEMLEKIKLGDLGKQKPASEPEPNTEAVKEPESDSKEEPEPEAKQEAEEVEEAEESKQDNEQEAEQSEEPEISEHEEL